jgi:hypothetical protein
MHGTGTARRKATFIERIARAQREQTEQRKKDLHDDPRAGKRNIRRDEVGGVMSLSRAFRAALLG